MLALLVEDVTLIKQRQLTVAVRFRGGAITTLMLPRPLTAQQLRATHEGVRRQIDALLDEYTDAEVAHILNQRGLRTGAGDAFDPVSVQWVRFSAKLDSLKDRLLAAGWLTSKQIAARIGVSRTTLARMRAGGRIKGRICNRLGEWLYWPPALPRPEFATTDAHVAANCDGVGEDLSREMTVLLAEHTDAQVADILNRRGLRTGAGDSFDPITVQWVRSSARLESLEERLRAAGWLTPTQIAQRLGVHRSTVADWRDKGRICNDRGEWLYSPPRQLVPDGKTPAPHAATDDEGSSTAGGAV